MIKLVALIKKAEGVSSEKFRSWWRDHHAPEFARLQAAYLRKYVLNLPMSSNGFAGLPPGAPGSEPAWDGCAELWFDNADDLKAAFSAVPGSSFPSDVIEHVGATELLVVKEHEIALGRDALDCPSGSLGENMRLRA